MLTLSTIKLRMSGDAHSLRTMARVSWAVVSLCVLVFLFATTATYAPAGRWLMDTMLFGSMGAGVLSLGLAAGSTRRANRQKP